MDERSFPREGFRRPALRNLGAYLLLLVVSVLLFFARLRSPLLEPEDAFYAEVPRQMLAEGEWLIPTHEGRPFYQKPPLLYWLIMASYSVFGVHDWAARLVPCFAGLGIVLVTFWWGKRLLGLRAGLAGALILCLSGRFVHQTRMITMDGLLCFWILCSLALAQQAVQSRKLRWRLWLLSAVCCGLGMLTKGPVALILVVLPILAHQIFDRGAARPGGWPWPAYLGTALALTLPWYAAVAWRISDFAHEFLWNHHVVLRFVQPMHDQPVWYYLPTLLLGMLPWTLLVPGMIKLLLRRFRAGEGKVPTEVWFLLVCCSWCLLFYSMAPCKRVGYILPAMPTFALALGHALDRRLPGQGVWEFFRLGETSLPYWTTHAVLGTATLFAVAAGIADLIGPGRCMALTALGAATIAALIVGRRIRKNSAARGLAGSWAGCALAAFAFLFLAAHVLLPGHYRKFSLRAQVQSFQDCPEIPVVCHPHHCDSVSFYLGHRDIRSYGRDERDRLIADLSGRPETIVFVKSGQVLNDLLEQLPDSLEFTPRGRASWMTAGLVRRRMITVTR